MIVEWDTDPKNPLKYGDMDEFQELGHKVWGSSGERSNL